MPNRRRGRGRNDRIRNSSTAASNPWSPNRVQPRSRDSGMRRLDKVPSRRSIREHRVRDSAGPALRCADSHAMREAGLNGIPLIKHRKLRPQGRRRSIRRGSRSASARSMLRLAGCREALSPERAADLRRHGQRAGPGRLWRSRRNRCQRRGSIGLMDVYAKASTDYMGPQQGQPRKNSLACRVKNQTTVRLIPGAVTGPVTLSRRCWRTARFAGRYLPMCSPIGDGALQSS